MSKAPTPKQAAFPSTLPMATQPPPFGMLWGDQRDTLSPSLLQDLGRFEQHRQAISA